MMALHGPKLEKRQALLFRQRFATIAGGSLLDGYDVVETIARQPWVLHGRPGMVGLSYPGISQLFVAQLQPPHLAAIAPLFPVTPIAPLRPATDGAR